MNSHKQARRLSSRALALALATVLGAQAPLARAGIVDTEVLVAPAQADADRAKVQAFLDRATVTQRLQALGLDGLRAHERVAALNEAEVHALAQRIDTLPAGGALSHSDLVIILLVAILVAIAL